MKVLLYPRAAPSDVLSPAATSTQLVINYRLILFELQHFEVDTLVMHDFLEVQACTSAYFEGEACFLLHVCKCSFWTRAGVHGG